MSNPRFVVTTLDYSACRARFYCTDGMRKSDFGLLVNSSLNGDRPILHHLRKRVSGLLSLPDARLFFFFADESAHAISSRCRRADAWSCPVRYA
jgi:hypothetical protein